ncbi:MAG: D-glycerate 3-kinase [Congregibacter sp.]|jgi:D-glycerate 3-kinase
MISTFINKNKLSTGFQKIAEGYYIPLAEEIRMHQISAKKTYCVGINGSQGSGKSTLSAFLKDYLTETYDMNVVVMSLDDFYFSRIERQIIAADVHPLFTTRGVPGTHNMCQAKTVMFDLKQQQPTIIPRFDKATDNPHPTSVWTKVSYAADVVIFEGWCWGVEPQSSEQLKQPVNEFETIEDKNAYWRNHANLQLSLHYQPLYSHMDTWVMLKAPSFKDVYSWRLEQEQKLNAATDKTNNKTVKANNSDKAKESGIMNEQQIQRFIQHYQRLTEHALKTLPNRCDHVFELNSERAITAHKLKEDHA